MVRFTVSIPKELNDWLDLQAKIALRSKNKHVEHLLKLIKEEQEKQRLNEGQ